MLNNSNNIINHTNISKEDFLYTQALLIKSVKNQRTSLVEIQLTIKSHKMNQQGIVKWRFQNFQLEKDLALPQQKTSQNAKIKYKIKTSPKMLKKRLKFKSLLISCLKN